ncbi:MAG: tRNA (adenosine(37)-N6)-threonylcarbamoyltransferase complex ATPase subunit type 1 TsaE [Chloroflexota bacterium]
MPPLLLRSHTPQETRRIGAALGRYAEVGDVLLLCGELGAGKTCLTQGIARGLGIEEYVRSPTFVLVSIHRGRLPLYHIDIYRLDQVAEVLDLGLEEYLAGDGVSVIEWADKALEAFPQPFLLVTLDFEGEKERLIRLEPRGERYERLVLQVQDELSRRRSSRRARE